MHRIMSERGCKVTLRNRVFKKKLCFLPQLYYTCVKLSIQKLGELLAAASGDWGYLNRGFSQIKGLEGGECLRDVH